MVEQLLIRRVKCPRCGYEWYTRSVLGYLTCPSCYKRFPNPYKQSKSQKQ